MRVEPRLSAGAATGERTVFIAARRFGRNEARRLAVHEVYGHLLAAANGRAQPLRLLSWGTADSFADQEGVALYMEERAGVLDAVRLRILAGRVLASRPDARRRELRRDRTQAGTAKSSSRCAEAIGIAERAYRGGGVARDAGYLLGCLRVHAAVTSGAAKLEELQLGRVSLAALPGDASAAAAGLRAHRALSAELRAPVLRSQGAGDRCRGQGAARADSGLGVAVGAGRRLRFLRKRFARAVLVDVDVKHCTPCSCVSHRLRT